MCLLLSFGRPYLLLSLALLIISIPLLGRTIGAWLALPVDARPGDVIVVLGGGYPERIYAGLDLYDRGLAPEVWHTGDIPPPGAKLSLADRAKLIGQRRGVPADAFTVLATHSTWEDGQVIAALARERGVHRLLIVTDWTHSRRALCVIRLHLAGSGIVATFAAAPPRSYAPQSWWYSPSGIWALRREIPAIFYYWYAYGVNSFSCEP